MVVERRIMVDSRGMYCAVVESLCILTLNLEEGWKNQSTILFGLSQMSQAGWYK